MKNRSISGLKRKTINVQREKARRDYIIDWYLKKLDLTCNRKPLLFIDYNRTCLSHMFLNVVQDVFYLPEISLGTCWEFGTLSKMRCLSWTTPFMPSKKVCSSMGSAFFTSFFFDGLEGKNLSNSSITRFSELNVKFVTTQMNQWKRNNGEKM